MENKLLKVLIELVELFTIHKVDYVLAGGLAYSVLVEPRATMDIDFCCLTDEAGFEEIINLLKKKYSSIFIHEHPMKFGKIIIWRIIIFEDKEIVFLCIVITIFLL